MKHIPLTQGMSAIIDDDDFVAVQAIRWCAVCLGATSRFYAATTRNEKRVYLHRFLLAEPDGIVDHINGNPLDNRRTNLRVVTHAENVRNVHTAPGSNTRIRYVHRNARGNYVAKVVRDGTQHYLGSFISADAAVLAVRAFQRSNTNVSQLIAEMAKLELENDELRAELALLTRSDAA